MNCDQCGQPREEGALLLTGAVYWHTKPTFFCQPTVALPPNKMGRGHYLPRPAAVPAQRCRSYLWVAQGPFGDCANDWAQGFLFPMTSIRWWSGPGTFAPAFLFPFTGKSGEGARCRRCSAVTFRAEHERERASHASHLKGPLA